MVQQWHAEKEKLGKNDLDAREREEPLYKLANICTTVMLDKRGFVGDVGQPIGGYIPGCTTVHIRRYFGDLKGFGAVEELVTGPVPVHAAPTGENLERELEHENHPSVNKHLPAIWEKIGEEVRRHKCLVIQKSAAHEIPNLRVSPLAAVVTHKVRIIND